MNKLSVLIISTLISSFFVSAQNLGDFYQGGIIFYKDSMGKGLIVDISYLEANIDWIPHVAFVFAVTP